MMLWEMVGSGLLAEDRGEEDVAGEDGKSKFVYFSFFIHSFIHYLFIRLNLPAEKALWKKSKWTTKSKKSILST